VRIRRHAGWGTRRRGEMATRPDDDASPWRDGPSGGGDAAPRHDRDMAPCRGVASSPRRRGDLRDRLRVPRSSDPLGDMQTRHHRASPPRRRIALGMRRLGVMSVRSRGAWPPCRLGPLARCLPVPSPRTARTATGRATGRTAAGRGPRRGPGQGGAHPTPPRWRCGVDASRTFSAASSRARNRARFRRPAISRP
jgi:hypothetical protein